MRLEKASAARDEFQKILDHKGANWGLIYSLSHRWLARAAALAGDTARARQAYQDFFVSWKNADTGSARLAEARKEFVALEQEK